MGEIIEVPSTISTTWPWGVEDSRWAFANLARRRARMVLALRYHHSSLGGLNSTSKVLWGNNLFPVIELQ